MRVYFKWCKKSMVVENSFLLPPFVPSYEEESLMLNKKIIKSFQKWRHLMGSVFCGDHKCLAVVILPDSIPSNGIYGLIFSTKE